MSFPRTLSFVGILLCHYLGQSGGSWSTQASFLLHLPCVQMAANGALILAVPRPFTKLCLFSARQGTQLEELVLIFA